MSSIKAYTDAVALRKAIEKKNQQQVVNHAVLYQLEGDDIPRLLEIIRIQDNALRAIIDLVETENMELESHHADTAVRTAAAAHLRCEDIASEGSTKKWGDFDGH